MQQAIDAVRKRGSPIVANRLLAALRPMFRWAVESGRLSQSPVDRMSNPVSEKGRARDHVLEDAELPRIWAALDRMAYPFGPMFQLLLLTGQRRGEVAAMRWEQLDLRGAVWVLPPEATKAGRAHDVPLSTQAVKVINNLPRFEGSPYVFAARGNPDAASSGFSKALKRAHELSGVCDWSIHDLRRTVASGLARFGVQLPVLAAVLNHSPGQVMGITAVYNRHRYSEEKRAALQQWGDHLERLVGAPAGH